MSLLKAPMHPGEVLATLYLEPMNLSAGALAKHLRLPRTRIERLVKGEVGMSIDTALRLGRVFSTSGKFWMNLQTNFDVAQLEDDVDLTGIEPLLLAG